MREPNAYDETVAAPVEPAEVLAVEPPPMQPVQLGERVEIIDILRGFALFGILCVNMQFYTTPFTAFMSAEPYWPELHDRIATGVIGTLFEGKFYILFSFLFGFGICVQMLRADERGKSFALHQVKRMLVLLGIGLTHALLLWMGDVLVSYALIGLLFLVFVRCRPKTLVIFALCFYLIPLAFMAVVAGGFELFAHFGPSLAEASPEFAKFYEEFQAGLKTGPAEQIEAAEEAKRVYSSGTYRELFLLRGEEVLFGYMWMPLVFWPNVAAMFLLGLWAGKKGVFTNLDVYERYFRKLLWPALALGLAGNLVATVAGEYLNGNMPDRFMFLAFLGMTVGAPPLTFFYVSTLVLLARNEAWRQRLWPIAYVGRMALTNYLLQSVICTTIFYSYGGGLYAGVGPLAGLALTVAIYLPQIPFSMLWLARFRFGPMEWLWRTLTYGKMQPMRL